MLARRTLFALACTFAVGCGDDTPMNQPAPDMAVTPPDMVIPLRDPTQHPSETMISYQGGRLLTHTDVVTVLWPGDALATQREQFAEWVINSSYWDPLQEYGVMRGSARGPYTITDNPPFSAAGVTGRNLDDSDVGALLRAKIMDGTLPMPTADSLYVLYLPANTTSTYFGAQGCSYYGGYHGAARTGLTSGPKTMAYAIIPECAGMPGYNYTAGDAEDFLIGTNTESHEIAEAATDPENTGWQDPNTPLSEIGDLCTPLSWDYHLNVEATDGGTVFADGGSGMPTKYTVNRLWSAQTAAAGKGDPCLPVPASPYVWFGAGVAPNKVVVSTDSSGNGSTTFEIQDFAEGDIGGDSISWQLTIGLGSGVPAGFQLSATQGHGVPGSTQKVTVKVNRNAAIGAYPVYVYSSHGFYSNVWPATIVVQ